MFNYIYLTARQKQVLKLLCDLGKNNKSIGKSLNITESTVKMHISNIFKKCGVHNRTQLVVLANNKTFTF